MDNRIKFRCYCKSNMSVRDSFNNWAKSFQIIDIKSISHHGFSKSFLLESSDLICFVKKWKDDWVIFKEMSIKYSCDICNSLSNNWSSSFDDFFDFWCKSDVHSCLSCC